MDDSRGAGLTFTDEDYKQAQFIAGLLQAAKWPSLSVTEMFKGTAAISWYDELMKKMKDNVMEVKAVRKIKGEE